MTAIATEIEVPESVLKYHTDVLAMYNNSMYADLIKEHHIISDTLKQVEFEGLHPLRGRFAKKDNQKYWLDEELLENLPIKVKESEELLLKDDIVFHPTRATKFRIAPEHIYDIRYMVDDYAPFLNTDVDSWTFLKMLVFAADIGRTYLCISSKPSMGKTQLFSGLDFINNRTPVFEPRSIPGVLNKINGTGNMVFDDILNVPADPRKIMEQMNMQIGGGRSIYINGAMKSANTKNRYNTHLQSMTYLYNNTEYYTDPLKKYFDFMFENNGAIDSRFLKLKIKGELIQNFTRDFNIKGLSDKYQDHYMNIAKSLLWYQDYKQTGEYERKWVNNNFPNKLTSRQKITYDEVTWVIDNYCQSQDEYDKFITIFKTAINDYRYMIDVVKDEVVAEVEEEEIV